MINARSNPNLSYFNTLPLLFSIVSVNNTLYLDKWILVYICIYSSEKPLGEVSRGKPRSAYTSVQARSQYASGRALGRSVLRDCLTGWETIQAMSATALRALEVPSGCIVSNCPGNALSQLIQEMQSSVLCILGYIYSKLWGKGGYNVTDGYPGCDFSLCCLISTLVTNSGCQLCLQTQLAKHSCQLWLQNRIAKLCT